MGIRNKLIESLSSTWKSRIILYLKQEGYVTYANRLEDIKFIIADMYHGERIEVAAMIAERAEMVINPAMVDTSYFQGQTKKMMDQLSVLVRHELLHFLLVHSKRLIDHLVKINPNWKKDLRGYPIGRLSNLAADWDLSREGYDEHDKEVVRLMTRNGKVIGGLILSDDHPEWINLTYEEILDKLIEERTNAINKAKKDLKNSLPQSTKNSNDGGGIDIDLGGDDDQCDEETDSSSNSSTEKDDSEKEPNNNQGPSNLDSNTNQDDSEDSSTSDEELEKEDKTDYANSWNEIMDRFDNDEISDDELEQLIADIESGKIISL